MSATTITLSEAQADDSDSLLAWRNDAAAIAASLDARPVSQSDHDRWFARVLADPLRTIYIARESTTGERVGMCRFDSLADHSSTVISINVAPAWRGRGIGGLLLSAALGRFRDDHATPHTVVAQVRRDNAASTRLFLAAGFVIDSVVDDVQSLSRSLN